MTTNNVNKASVLPALLQDALSLAYQSLDSYFDNPNQIELAFGSNYNQTVASQLFTAFAQGNFSEIPEIEILSNDVLEATNGAYSTSKNKIYLNERFLNENVGDTQAIASVLIEEIGHFIDAQINTTDSAGDEGDIFARLVQGETLTSEVLANLKAEDDSKTIVLGGEAVEIEQNIYLTGANDIWHGAVWSEKQYGNGGNDKLYGYRGHDSLYGGDGDDTLDGGRGNDFLEGDSGNDKLVGWTGDDHLRGGPGNDTLIGGKDNGDGSDSGNDILVGWTGDDLFWGGDGNDILYGDSDSGYLENSGNDKLYGQDGNDQLYGGDGKDLLNPGYNPGAQDTVDGGNGNDTLQADYSSKTDGFGIHLGDSGNLRIANRLYGQTLVSFSNVENFDITGTQYDDVFEGRSGNDTLKGGNGEDQLFGGNGDDFLDGGWGKDTLDGGSGIDTADFSYASGGYLFDLPKNNVNGESIRNIENIIGTQGNDTIIGDDVDNKFKGGNGNDQLYGYEGNDILAGGTGINDLWGGEGNDIFVMDTGGVQVIKDFQRGIDKIDMADSQVNKISFETQPIGDSTTTIIKVDGQERVRVEGSLVDSSSLIETSKDINPLPLSPAEIKNISQMLQKWAESYAQSLGLSTSNVKLVNDQLSLVGGDLTFIDSQEEKVKNMTRNSSMFFRNNSSADSSVTFTYSDGTGYEISSQDTTEWTVGHSVGGSVSTEINRIWGKIAGEAHYEWNYSYGGSHTTIKTNNVNRQDEVSHNFTAPAGTVTKAIATGIGGEYESAEYEIPITISGTIGIDLNGDEDALDTNEIKNLPVNAILQHYNPQQFVGPGFQRTFELPQGQVLLYNETTQAKVTGTADGAYFNSVKPSIASAYDWSLTNPTTSEYLNGVNYQAQINTGNAVGQGIEERYWLIRKGEYSPRPSGAILRIEGFTPSEDFIGIEHNAINSKDDILLATDVPTGIDPNDTLILRRGSYIKDNATFQTTQILMGGTGSDFTTIADNDILAELINVAPTQLLGSSDGSPRTSLTRGELDTNFMFGTQGTIWDNSLADKSGTNLLQLLETV